MKNAILSVVLVASGLQASAPSEVKAKTPPPAPAVAPVVAAQVDDQVIVDADAGLRPRMMRRAKGSYEMTYDPKVIPTIFCQMRHQSTVSLPPGEKIRAISCGDDDIWEVIPVKDGNVFSLKPTYPDVKTSLLVLTAAGNRYVFEATSEPSKHFMAILDILPPAWMKQMLAAEGIKGSPRAVGARQAAPGMVDMGSDEDPGIPKAVHAEAVAKARIEGERMAHESAKAKAEEDEREYITAAFKKASFSYRVEGGFGDFKINRVWDDGQLTYIVFSTSTNQAPVFHEIQGAKRVEVDGERSVMDPTIYIVSKIFQDGEISLAPGKSIRIKNTAYDLKGRKEAQTTQPKNVKKIEG